MRKVVELGRWTYLEGGRIRKCGDILGRWMRRRVGVLIRWVNVSEVVDGMKTKGYLGDPEALWLFSSISMVRMRNVVTY